MKSILIFCFCILNVFLLKAQQLDAFYLNPLSGVPSNYTISNQIYTSSFLSSGGEVLNGRTFQQSLIFSDQTSKNDFLTNNNASFNQLMYDFKIGIKGRHQIDLSIATNKNNNWPFENSNRATIPISVKYHYQLLNEKYFFQVAPIFSGFFNRQFYYYNKSNTIFGYDFTLPISKKIGKYFSVRYNLGFTQFINYQYDLYNWSFVARISEKRNPFMIKNGLNCKFNWHNRFILFAEAEHRNFNQYNFDVNSNLQLNNKTKWQRNIGLMYVSNIKKAKLMYSINVPQFLNTYEMGIILGLTYQHKY
jgi:hypothetical protein